MFLQSEDHDINDFLKAVNFIAPQGYNLKYFIVPYAANNTILAGGAAQNGFEVSEPESNSQDVKGITDTITYLRKDMKNRQSFNDSNFNLNQIPNEFPITRPQTATSNLEPLQTDLISAGTIVPSPIAGVKVLESKKEYIDMKLEENVGCFPKHTILHFTKTQLNESFKRIAEGVPYEDRIGYVDELCDRAVVEYRNRGESNYKDALFFGRYKEGFVIKGLELDAIIDEIGSDDPEAVWEALTEKYSMRKLYDISKPLEIKYHQLNLKWR